MAPLKARPRRTSGLLPSCTGTGPPLAALALPRYVDELLKDSKTWWVFTWKDCSENNLFQKAKERSRLPGFAVTELFCLWWPKPPAPAGHRDGTEKAWVYIHKQGKGALADWCLYSQSTLVVALQVCREEGLHSPPPGVTGKQREPRATR